MKKLLTLLAAAMLLACGGKPTTTEEDDDLNITSKFNSTWNIYEHLTNNDDGSITFEAVKWGGLAADFTKNGVPVDWSDYESIVFELAEPTKVYTQIWVTEKLIAGSYPGATTLKCNFDGQDVSAIGQVALQTSEPTTITVKKIYLTPAGSPMISTPIWSGECEFGNWENGFNISPDHFITAEEGDKIEFIYNTDHKNPSVSYWQFKTTYNTTDITLEGNHNELNEWGCATVGSESTDYRIILTAKDAEQLKEYGLSVVGYYNIVRQCNLLQPYETD